MPYKIKDLYKKIYMNEERMEKISNFLKDNRDKFYTENEIEKETGIKCAGSLLHSELRDSEKAKNICRANFIYSQKIIGDDAMGYICGNTCFFYYKEPTIIKVPKTAWWKSKPIYTTCPHCRKETLQREREIYHCKTCGNKFYFKEVNGGQYDYT